MSVWVTISSPPNPPQTSSNDSKATTNACFKAPPFPDKAVAVPRLVAEAISIVPVDAIMKKVVEVPVPWMTLMSLG